MSAFPRGTMSLSGHLRELRKRVVICIVCLLAAFLAALSCASAIINQLTAIGKEFGYQYVFLAPQELMMQHFSVAMLIAVCVTLPVIGYHVWAFIRPGLNKDENRLFVAALFFGLVCFLTGAAFAYKVMVPVILYFLIDISVGSDITAAISVQSYLSFLFTLFLIFGAVFELPVLTVLLTQIGILKTSWMKKGRRVVIVGIFLIAAIITPPDVVSQILVAIPILALYEMSIHLCDLLLKVRRKRASFAGAPGASG